MKEAGGDRYLKKKRRNTSLANVRMMSIVGMHLHEEWMEGRSGDRLLKKNNTNLANLRMTSIVGMNVHEEWMERSEWW